MPFRQRASHLASAPMPTAYDDIFNSARAPQQHRLTPRRPHERKPKRHPGTRMHARRQRNHGIPSLRSNLVRLSYIGRHKQRIQPRTPFIRQRSINPRFARTVPCKRQRSMIRRIHNALCA